MHVCIELYINSIWIWTEVIEERFLQYMQSNKHRWSQISSEIPV